MMKNNLKEVKNLIENHHVDINIKDNFG